MKLYSGPLSLFTAKVRIALAEKGLTYERIEVPFDRKAGYDPKHFAVLEHNPKAQVPVFVDEDVPAGDPPLVLWDSTVIVEYLDERHPEPPLLPRDTVGRSRARMLELHSDEVFFPHVLTLIREVFYADPKALQEMEMSDSVVAARTGLAREYAELDRALAGREWLVGDHMTAADVAFRLSILFATSLGSPPPDEHSALAGWIARMNARPSIATEFAEIAEAIRKLS